MRIGIYCSDLPRELGGAHTYVTSLLDALAGAAKHSAHDFVILCPASAAPELRSRLSADNVAVVPAPTQSAVSLALTGLKYFSPLVRRALGTPAALERAARELHVELLWFLGIYPQISPDLPYIATVLDMQHRIQPFFPEVSARGVWDKREQFYGHFLRRATYCLTGTETGRREIERFYQLASERVRVLPLPTPGFALHAARSALDVESRFGIRKPYLFYPAQFWPHKNHANLVLALKLLRERHGADLSLALSGSDKGNLGFVKDFVARQGLERQVHFVGFVSTEELIALYQNAAALSFVTYFGPDNIPPLEAFALGCPVVASGVDGAIEQYGNAALLVNPSDPEHIAEAVRSLLASTELRARLIASGLERARKFTSSDYIRGMLALFDEFSAIRRNWP